MIPVHSVRPLFVLFTDISVFVVNNVSSEEGDFSLLRVTRVRHCYKLLGIKETLSIAYHVEVDQKCLMFFNTV